MKFLVNQIVENFCPCHNKLLQDLGETQKGHEESLEKRGRRPKTTVLEKLFKSHKNDLGCKQKNKILNVQPV
jgi:hypothetical protein